ncbi:hypothetical protein V6N12_028506 [Hibiscus sabdariffa]|uniref:Uncharacterized protein n=1 Tax=Hibiscus sabdariffa TaxID=183260 RepID=A0ABR2F615_9ROSI
MWPMSLQKWILLVMWVVAFFGIPPGVRDLVFHEISLISSTRSPLAHSVGVTEIVSLLWVGMVCSIMGPTEKETQFVSMLFVIGSIVASFSIIFLFFLVIMEGLHSLVYIFNYIFPFNKLNSGRDGEIRLSVWLTAPACIVCWMLVPLSGWLLYNVVEKNVIILRQQHTFGMEPRICLYALAFHASSVSAIFFSLHYFDKVDARFFRTSKTSSNGHDSLFN